MFLMKGHFSYELRKKSLQGSNGTMNFHCCNILYKRKHCYPYTVYIDFQMIFGEVILLKENHIIYKNECLSCYFIYSLCLFYVPTWTQWIFILLIIDAATITDRNISKQLEFMNTGTLFVVVKILIKLRHVPVCHPLQID